MTELSPLIQTIQMRAKGMSRPLIVALDGRSGAGKSTTARQLARALPASCIEGDDFYAGGTGIVPGPPHHLASICINWRRQRSTLETLRLGRSASYPPFDWAAFTGALARTPVTIAATPIILFEGVYTARPELQDLTDFRVLLTLPDHLRLTRLRIREGGLSDWENQWLRAEDWYFNHALTDAAIDHRLTGA